MPQRKKTATDTTGGATKFATTRESKRIRTRSVARVEAALAEAVAAASSTPPSSGTLAIGRPPTKTKAKAASAIHYSKGKGKRAREESEEEEEAEDVRQQGEEGKDTEDNLKKPKSKRARKDTTDPSANGKDKHKGFAAAPPEITVGHGRKKPTKNKTKDAADLPQKIVRPVPPVDPMSGLVDTHEVLVTSEGVWDAMLNQTNVGKNANKFYALQLLHPIRNKRDCGPWTPATAVDMFKKQFRTKAGVKWEQRFGMVPKKGKYDWLERSYDDGDDTDEEEKGEDSMSSGSFKVVREEKIPGSTLPPEIQALCRLIFDSSLLDAHLSSMNYDANKLPLGKLAKSTILNGFAALKTLSEVIAEPAGPTALLRGGFRPAVEELTGQYYTIIPHVFGREKPIVIDNIDRLKKELELVDALGDMEVASKLIASTIPKDADGRPVNPLDAYFRSLQLTKMEPVPRMSSELAALETYMRNTNDAGTHHHYDTEILQVFRVERAHETAAWTKAGYGSIPVGDRLLLWHGSRTTNFVGILKQGLRIAPPEAPASGYMFGKGVYFADVMSKSANYCHACLSDNTGLLLLCEVAAKPFFEQYEENCNAGQDCKKAGARSTKGLGRAQPSEWQDAGAALNNPELRGCFMPKGPMITSDPRVHLHHNEYIVYDVSQIRLRYLLIVKMT
ncbi:hypothetical protein ONZ51_g1850 [Trametes cubensis]|uniref:Poly [ADP-ribose] polymerase n=1 Tax=Trametes cubensis TaxID=1111947 RepID=A0AAD7XCK0_9APHY|nr:hypothetical protein ONZ51_g1850 [Trametes cubensis]